VQPGGVGDEEAKGFEFDSKTLPTPRTANRRCLTILFRGQAVVERNWRFFRDVVKNIRSGKYSRALFCSFSERPVPMRVAACS
jgi:hypothetical protein